MPWRRAGAPASTWRWAGSWPGTLARPPPSFQALPQEDAADAGARLFAALAAAFADEEGAWQRLATLAAASERRTCAKFPAARIHRCLRAGQFPRAAEILRVWLDEPEGARDLALPRNQLGLLAAYTLLPGHAAQARPGRAPLRSSAGPRVALAGISPCRSPGRAARRGVLEPARGGGPASAR